MTAEYDSERYAIINRWDSTHLDKIDRLLDLGPGDRVLEIGCGQGHLTKRLADRGIDITGIDANPNASHVSGSDRVVYMRAEALEFDDGVFDAIISVHAIEHIPDLKGAFAEMARVLRPGGKALFIYPAEPIMGLYAIPTAIILHKNPFMARKIHCQKLTPKKVVLMLGPHGFEERHREFNLIKSPQFVSVLEKVTGLPQAEERVARGKRLMAEFKCQDCGNTFELRQDVLDRYPGWTPRQCMDCRNKATPASGSVSKRPASKSKNRDLTVGEVLDSFTDGPSSGVFTDGAAEGNPGPGGWGAVYVADDVIIDERMGSEAHTTNNRMELTAMVAGLEMLPVDSSAPVYTDSKLIVDTLNTWAKGWKAKGWKRKTGPIANLELVQRAFELYEERPAVKVEWIRAHSGYRWNEYADALATSYRRNSH